MFVLCLWISHGLLETYPQVWTKKGPLARAGLVGSVGRDETAVFYWVRFVPERCLRPEACC